MADAGGARVKVALLGGGVIGCGWAARFMLTGHDVCLYDPNPEAAHLVEQTPPSGRGAVPRLPPAPARGGGALTQPPPPGGGGQGAARGGGGPPGREPLKRELLAAADRAAPPHAIITSSTSGL